MFSLLSTILLHITRHMIPKEIWLDFLGWYWVKQQIPSDGVESISLYVGLSLGRSGHGTFSTAITFALENCGKLL